MPNQSQWERDAAAGNDRLARAAFILEEMRQTGCLASEAAQAYDAPASTFQTATSAR